MGEELFAERIMKEFNGKCFFSEDEMYLKLKQKNEL